MREITTPSQTVGPFFHIGLERIAVNDLTAHLTTAKRITISGRVLDGDGKPVIDALVELWQADADGRYDGNGKFKGHGRVATDNEGAFSFTTIKPGQVPGANATMQAPHVAVNLFMRGLLKHLVTRMYFPDEPSNVEDAVLNSVPAERRRTLIANGRDGNALALIWDIALQGKSETVFFDC